MIRANGYQDPVLDSDPRWIEARSLIGVSDE
jgi:hypothetical protein